MAEVKNPPKFISAAPTGRGRLPIVLAVGDIQSKVIEDGLRKTQVYRYNEIVHVYQLVAVVKPKPMEFITETFAVCKAPAVEKESL
jgi:hypothetical protein